MPEVAVEKSRLSRGVTITVPLPMLRELHGVAADRLRQGQSGGISATIRELVQVGLAQRRRRPQRAERG